MTEEEAINRLAACKDLLELIEANLQYEALPLEGANNDQLDSLERLLEVDQGMYAKAPVRRKAKVNKEQVELLFNQRAFIEQRKIQKNLMGSKEQE